MISSEVASVADAVQGIVSTISRANVRLRIFFILAHPFCKSFCHQLIPPAVGDIQQPYGNQTPVHTDLT